MPKPHYLTQMIRHLPPHPILESLPHMSGRPTSNRHIYIAGKLIRRLNLNIHEQCE